MSDIEALKAGVAKLEAEEKTLDEQRLSLKTAENAAMSKLREVARELRQKRTARFEIERRIRAEENPLPPLTPEVETIIQTVTATAQAANAPPEAD